MTLGLGASFKFSKGSAPCKENNAGLALSKLKFHEKQPWNKNKCTFMIKKFKYLVVFDLANGCLVSMFLT